MESYNCSRAIGLFVLLAAAQSAFADHIAPNPKNWAGKPLEGNGECVTLVKKAANITAGTKNWKKGAVVKGASLKEGTAIATFVNGKYTGHAALYLGQNAEGIQVVDQWAERKSKEGKVVRPAQPPHTRTIKWNGKGTSNNGMLFHVIE